MGVLYEITNTNPCDVKLEDIERLYENGIHNEVHCGSIIRFSDTKGEPIKM